ncbi:MAG: hypothetical protein LBQ79_05975 [Deltaproteobacteria bacterium]|jgi:hypothetical protein|nr:hypothetical protein [Deltaproteobacteria bacterium]
MPDGGGTGTAAPGVRGAPPARRPESDAAALTFTRVRLAEDGKLGRQLDLKLMPGDAALVLHPSAQALRELIRIAMRQERPPEGTVTWGPAVDPRDRGLWGNLRFNLGIGLVHRRLFLVPGRTVLEHLALFFSYHTELGPEEILPRCRGLLRSVGVRESEMHEMGTSLPARLPMRLRILGLHALAAAKEPWLYIFECPGELGPDFPGVWRAAEDHRARGSAVLVLDEATRPAYGRAGFTRTVLLGEVPDAGGRGPDAERADGF